LLISYTYEIHVADVRIEYISTFNFTILLISNTYEIHVADVRIECTPLHSIIQFC